MHTHTHTPKKNVMRWLRERCGWWYNCARSSRWVRWTTHMSARTADDGACVCVVALTITSSSQFDTHTHTHSLQRIGLRIAITQPTLKSCVHIWIVVDGGSSTRAKRVAAVVFVVVALHWHGCAGMRPGKVATILIVLVSCRRPAGKAHHKQAHIHSHVYTHVIAHSMRPVQPDRTARSIARGPN